MAEHDDNLDLLHELRANPTLINRIRAATDDEFRLQKLLRGDFPPELVRGALLLCELRQKARAKFSRAEEMWFDATGLEQATAQTVARHKAARFREFPGEVRDLCCGIGSDSIALAEQGRSVIAVDRSAAAVLRTRWNAEVHGVADRIEAKVQDVLEITRFGSHVHIDPDRRAGQRRTTRLEQYHPPLAYLQHLTGAAPGGAIKLSPAANFGGKFPDCEIELVSLDGECKEATVWFGDLKGPTAWRATLLPEQHTLTGDPWSCRGQVMPLRQVIHDPDPAVVRAGLVDVLAEQAGFGRLDAAEEYLTSDDSASSVFVQSFDVLEELPFDTKELRAYFREHPCGELEIKCRHVPVDAEKLRRRLPLVGAGRLTLIVARIQGRARGVICRRRERLQTVPGTLKMSPEP